MNFAVVEIAGKQFLVQKNETIETPKLSDAAGDKVAFTQVLLYRDGKKTLVGRPYLEGFSVEGRIVKHDRYPKIVVYKYKRRKDSHRKRGHRQDFTAVEIMKIITPGRAEKPEEEKEKATTVKKKKPEEEKKISTVKKSKPKARSNPVPAAKKKTKAPAKKPAASKKPAAKKKSPTRK
ncbi:MAG: 50S ribosomal protein L21 [Candidatus Auribacterota bacterium]|nr:50S ribosomal protein L21 [Candidatus Auribacterota bacterium]